MSWTKQQEKVICSRGTNLLVSAAAGSGKTAVLVERILQKITDPDHPVDIDRILVVTFTKAAAAEMRERIADAISLRAQENPEDANLGRQSVLLKNAKISTIDSFCQSVIRNQFFRIGLEPSFRVGDDGEMKVLREDVLTGLLEKCYEQSDDAFLHFSESFGQDRGDKKLKEAVLQVYDYAMSEPWPDQWLEHCREMYRFEADDSWLESSWMQTVTDYLRAQLTGIAEAYADLIRQTKEPGGPYMYEDRLCTEKNVLEAAAQAQDFIQMADCMRGFETLRLPACRKKDAVDPERKEAVSDGRAKLAKQAGKLQETYFQQSISAMRGQMEAAAADVNVLIDLTQAFAASFSAAKRSENVLDFSDLEHNALRILVDEETGVPTEAAQEYQDFFEEIMIDEYQDSNYVQELLLMSISRQEDVHPNVFMVGDVKQSIYGFRLARPDLFMEKYRSYVNVTPPDREESAGGAAVQSTGLRSCRIELHTNFRSRPCILSFVNAVFERLMREDIGGITYTSDAALYPGGGIYPDGDPDRCRTQILLTEGGIEAETAIIAQHIKALTNPANPFQVTRKDGSQRPAAYKDIVILMRSLGEKADTMAQLLNDAGIPTHVQSKRGYFASMEVRTILSFLQIIDNPRQDIPLAAVLRCPVYAFTGDDLARIRSAHRNMLRRTDPVQGTRQENAAEPDFYEAIVWYAKEGEDAHLRKMTAGFLEDLKDYREKSTILQIHALISYLLQRSSYDKIVSAMPAGSQRLTNIRMLEERAAAFEKTAYRGLFQFNRYMEQMKTYDIDYGEASAVGENDDAVRIISIHKSKGLEYPIVFLSALGRKFNRDDSRKHIQLNAKAGIGVDAFNQDRRTKAPTMLKKAIRMMNESESMGEEMRVLYVGMTRAREKLILTAAHEKASDYAARMQGAFSAGVQVPVVSDGSDDVGSARFLSFYNRMNAGCFMDWISQTLSGRSDVCEVQYIPQAAPAYADARQIVSRRSLIPYLEQQMRRDDPQMQEQMNRLRERFPAADVQKESEALPAKVSVSELKIDRIRENGEDPEELFADTHQKSYIPAFVGEAESEASGASYGTAVHRVMECLNFAGSAAAISDGRDPAEVLEEQLDQMYADGRISAEILRSVSRRALTGFLRSPLFARMAAADAQGKLKKERPFVMQVSASEVRPDAPAAETVLVQGIMDAYFEEDGEIVLVDYKTDRVKTGLQLADRYRRQMELYAQALAGSTGKQTAQMLLYSFALNETVSCA